MSRPLLLSAALLALVPASSAVGATLVGDTVEIWSHAQLNDSESLRDTVAVVDPGVEYTATITSDIYDLDFGPTSITLTTKSPWYSPWFNSGFDPTAQLYRDLDFVGEPDRKIVGVEVEWTGSITPEDNAPLGYPAFSAAAVSWTEDSVRLKTGPYSFAEGSTVTIHLLTAVPEPGAACLALGGVAIAATRRRSRR
ncbi:hypothetical protein Pla108_14590 [Botrimarina colliarenosi]|uniref:PEP-CTERM protein-sorting domain-containing protein n=1 Tax=Botrimarina colliarenosi TaxID=2528001 RepID=A0A5C6AM10_9BACT|nr:hypothetical protein [Botrimarina colliarenosi]TWU00507.1 hypothetical protein Pla108_14590 [Botrimarina colliarenosi]